VLCRAAGMTWMEVTGTVGIGTIVTAFFMGPLITWFNQKISTPLLEEKQQ